MGTLLLVLAVVLIGGGADTISRFTARSIREPKARTISITATKAIFMTQRIRNRMTSCHLGDDGNGDDEHELHRQPV
jgi:hypothetical protein